MARKKRRGNRGTNPAPDSWNRAGEQYRRQVDAALRQQATQQPEQQTEGEATTTPPATEPTTNLTCDLCGGSLAPIQPEDGMDAGEGTCSNGTPLADHAWAFHIEAEVGHLTHAAEAMCDHDCGLHTEELDLCLECQSSFFLWMDQRRAKGGRL